MAEPIRSLQDIEADCMGIDGVASWHLYGPVVCAADKLLSRMKQATVQPSAPKDMAFGQLPHTSKQSHPVDSVELHAARAVLEELVAGDGTVHGVQASEAAAVVETSFAAIATQWNAHHAQGQAR